MAQRPKSISVTETCNRFLGAAEEVYIQYGYYGSSIRAIAKLADRNLGTLHHYWSGKQALFKELFESRFTPLRDQHTKYFLKLKDKHQSTGELDLREVIRVLVEPFFFDEDASATDENLHKLYSRVLGDAALETMKVMNDLFEEPVTLFVELIHTACPALSSEEFRIRVNYTLNASFYQEIFSFENRLEHFMEPGLLSDRDRIECVINYLVAGLNAPPFIKEAPIK